MTQIIDVTVATWNSVTTIERCLKAIYSNVPVRKLIVVDGGSTDGTVEIAKRFGAIVIHEPGLLGKVRYVQADSCETDWIAYIDSDVYTYASWWPQVARYLYRSDVGIVLGLGDTPQSGFPIYNRYLKHNTRKYGSEAFSNTLIRRKLVLECPELLNRVHAGEDSLVFIRAKRKGLRAVTIPLELCYHDKDVVKSHPNAYHRWGQSVRIRWGVAGWKRVLQTLGNIVRNWWNFSIETSVVSLKLLVYLFKLWIWTIVGFCSVQRK